MQIYRYLPYRSDEPCALAIGNFDGVHLGHRAVIKTMVRYARPQNLIPSVLTFEPHPRRYFQPDAPNFRIAPLRDKLGGLRSIGVRNLFMPRFDAAMANTLAEEFLTRILRDQLNAKVVVVGENFQFGQKRRGNIAMMKNWGAANNIRVVTVPAVKVGEAVCSSTMVREAVARGDMAAVAQLTGRNYRLSGHVVRGDGRGKTIGFPTANLHLGPDLLLPARGVYAVHAAYEGRLYQGVANLGVRPTVAVDSAESLEIHLFDFEQEIYGKALSVSLVHKIRDEQKFDSVETLRQQIAADCRAARESLAEAS